MHRLAALLGLGVLGWVGWTFAFPPPDGVRFFDVGQGDAALVSAGRNQILIDGGPDRPVLRPLGSAMPPLDRRIEFAILTHPHTDHYRGLLEVFRRYRVGTLIVGAPGKEAEYRAVITEAQRRGTRVVLAAGQRVRLNSRFSVSVIQPLTAMPDRPVADPNNASVVAMVMAGPARILMTGDMGFAEERELVATGRSLDADVLKVGHHGSRTSSSSEFLQAVTPREAVISSGAGNKYGHPTAEALERLTAAGARIYRTDRRGTVTLRLSGNGYRLMSKR